MAQNKTKSGVKTTESGLQYEIVKDGEEGEQPKDTSRVRVHYTGTLIDGTEFDSSVKRGEPAEFAVGGVIPGWTEALKMMKKVQNGSCMFHQNWDMASAMREKFHLIVF